MLFLLLKLWLIWMPFAFGVLMLSEQSRYNPFGDRPHYPSIIFCSIIWPIYYVLALFHKWRG